MGRTKTALVFLVLLAIADAFNLLTPGIFNKEATYTWTTIVKAATNLPTNYASQFGLHGKIHVQTTSNCTLMKITDLSYKLYNGILDNVQEHEAHGIAAQIEDLQHVFRIVYDSDGHALGIATEAHEHEFSRNMKKAMANIFQLDKSVLTESNCSFVKTEPSIYGNLKVDYTVRHQGEEIEVEKQQEMPDSSYLYGHMVSDGVPNSCDIGYENSIMHSSRRSYRMVKQDGHQVVEKIVAVGSLVYNPFNAQSDHQFIVVDQTFHLDQVTAIGQQFHMQTENFEDNLGYTFGLDVTGGRHSVDYDQVIPTIKHLLDDFYQYLQEDHINTEEPDSPRGQMVNRVQRLLLSFNYTKLEELQASLSGYAREAFHHILPFVGTQASTMFIKHLVMDQVVDERVASTMLQKFHEHVIEPSPELVGQMEVLMNLPDKFSWNLKKVAILSFSNLVSKSYYRALTQSTMANQAAVNALHQTEIYEKYVIGYLNKVKNSHDFKEQMVYTLGLANMRLPTTRKHMLPTQKGAWPDNPHLRILYMTAAALSTPETASQKNDVMVELLLPIFTDREATTEERLFAFYYIMESDPPMWRLMELSNCLLNETNEEVYNFVYSYVHSMKESNEPCKQKFKVKMEQFATFLPPPSHGMSYFGVSGYYDPHFGFSGGYRYFYIKGDHGHLFELKSITQHLNVPHDDLTVYIKVDGISQFPDVINLMLGTFNRKTPQITHNKDLHVEVIIARPQQMVNCFYFNQHNLHELDDLLDFFTKDSQTVHEIHREFVDLTYKEYNKAVIPLDIGIPAIWDFIMPQTQHYNMSVTKRVTNNVINVHVDNKYTNWIHYRHGLTFYNPIADVWQGINRMHSYDAVWPQHFDISLNTQQQSLQISWLKHNNPQLDVAGFRSHVVQKVFIVDDNKRDALMQSSPKSKPIQDVGYGKQFNNDYTVVDDDDLNTGRLWRVKIYDTEHHISNGSFRHKIRGFFRTYNSDETPISYLLTSWTHWQQQALFMPSPGPHGIMVRVDPSVQHSVSSIDLSLRLHADSNNDTTYHYSPSTKWSTRLTYSIKNKQESLKTWDINSILDLNAGRTVNNVKMYLTRIVPGQKDYKICVDGVKKWTDKQVEGHLNIAMSQSPDGKCVKDDTVIDVTMTGQRSSDQEDGHHKYGACEYSRPYGMPHQHTMQCLADHTTVRHYVYNVKTANVPTEFRKTLAHWWDMLKGHYVSHYDYVDEHHENVAENNFKVDVVYLMHGREVDVHITTPQIVYKLSAVPIGYWKWLGMVPNSIEYPVWFRYLHMVGAVDHCVVSHDHRHWNQKNVREMVPNDWTLYAGDVEQNPHKGVFVKNMANQQIAVKVVDNGHTFEITPHGDSHQISVDGQGVPSTEYYHKDWIHWHMFIQDTNKPVAVIFRHSGIHLEYEHHQVVVVLPKIEHRQEMHGRCYNNSP